MPNTPPRPTGKTTELQDHDRQLNSPSLLISRSQSTSGRGRQGCVDWTSSVADQN